jgi:hypothetical protein
MFILYILIGAIVIAAGLGLLYGIGWALEKFFPNSPLFGDVGEPVLTALMGLIAVMITTLVVMITYGAGAGIIGLITGGK